MATMFFSVNPVSRSHGSNAVGRAAYIARERLRAESLHRSFDYRARGGLQHSEILLPEPVRASADWARDRAQLWNAAEESERRRNSRVAREYVVALPHELGLAARVQLARGFAQGIADRYGAAVDLAVHHAPPGGDPRNFHAHMLSTTREVSGRGFGAKTAADIPDEDRRARGLTSGATELRFLRHWWADHANEQLRDAGLELRIDARSHWERGDEHVPRPTLTREMIQLERAGVQCAAAERLREAHALQVQQLREWREANVRAPSDELVMDLTARDAAPELAAGRSPSHSESPRAPTPAELERQAIERWLAYRNDPSKSRAAGLSRGLERDRDRGAEFEL